jgi:hypothetical protein
MRNQTSARPGRLDGWHVGPALESYRCYKIWIWETRALRSIDTLTWFPSKVKLPDSSSTDIILSCLQDVLHALNNPSPKSPLAPRTDTQMQALHDLIALLGSVSPKTPALLVTPPTAAVPTTKTNAPLRVRFMPTEPVQASDQPLRVATPNTVPTPTLILDNASPTVPCLMIDEFLEEQYEAEHGHISPTPFGFEGCIPQQPSRPSLRVLPTASTEACHYCRQTASSISSCSQPPPTTTTSQPQACPAQPTHPTQLPCPFHWPRYRHIQTLHLQFHFSLCHARHRRQP